MVYVFSMQVFAADYYFVGVDAFKKGSYEQASLNLEHAIRVNSKNVNARYYLAQSYLMQQRVFDAQEQYKRIILVAPGSDAAILSEKGLYLIKQAYSKTNAIASQSELERYKDNYIDYVLSSGGDVKKWASFPLNVYIEQSPHKDAVLKAFSQWQDKSQKLVSFNFINSSEKADISIDFKNKLESTSTKESFIAGYTVPTYKGIHISKAAIHLLTIDPESQKEFGDDFIFATTLHELGHALGFIGHSPNENDVMAAATVTPKMELTSRDINTLNVFYRANKETLLARNNGQTDLKLQQARDYIAKMPNKSVGWLNMGDIYYARKMYSDAIKSYKQAVEIEPDKASSYNSLGVAYRMSGDKQNAFLSFKKACDLDKSSKFFLSQFVASCSEIGKTDMAQQYIDDFNKAYPNEALK